MAGWEFTPFVFIGSHPPPHAPLAPAAVTAIGGGGNGRGDGGRGEVGVVVTTVYGDYLK